MRQAGFLILTAALTVFHLTWYTRVVAWQLWELTGGICREGRWTTLGASDWAWTVPLHLPAGLLLASRLSLLSLLGGLALLAGFLVAGYGAAALVVDLWSRRLRYWRMALFLAGWFWILVPTKISWIYQWTVVY
jgi:hypothetical protein